MTAARYCNPESVSRGTEELHLLLPAKNKCRVLLARRRDQDKLFGSQKARASACLPQAGMTGAEGAALRVAGAGGVKDRRSARPPHRKAANVLSQKFAAIFCLDLVDGSLW